MSETLNSRYILDDMYAKPREPHTYTHEWNAAELSYVTLTKKKNKIKTRCSAVALNLEEEPVELVPEEVPPPSILLSGDVEQNPGPQNRNMRKRNRKGPKRSRKPSPKGEIVYRGKHFMPPRFKTRLQFNKFGIINNAGAVNANIRFVPTYAYDVDPAVGSTALPGFTELAGCYRRYRVNSFTARTTFTNKEGSGAVVWMCPVNFDPAVNTASYQNYLSNPDCRNRMLGVVSGNAVGTLTVRSSVANFSGISNARVDDSTTASTTVAVAPVNNIWLGIGFVQNQVAVNGVEYNLILHLEIEFYELTSPAT